MMALFLQQIFDNLRDDQIIFNNYDMFFDGRQEWLSGYRAGMT